jgi:hypothetical protein
MNKPTIGRTVLYKLGEEDKRSLYTNGTWGNTPDVAPATIVSVFSDTCVNLKVCIDGYRNDLWKTSVSQGDGAGQWNWPVIQ